MRRFAIAIAALGLVACLDTGTTDGSTPSDPSDPATETFTGFNPPIDISSDDEDGDGGRTTRS